jgi:hypothetical protein
MIRSITIEPVLNGFVLQVGCQKVVFNDTKTLANEIRRYYDDPEGVEASYIKNAVNEMQGAQEAPPALMTGTSNGGIYTLTNASNLCGTAQLR